MNKIIISDSSCLIALEKINLLDLLGKLYSEVNITEEVNEEYGKVLPEWIVIRKVKNITKQLELENKLDAGEASSIALALEINNSILIIDETKGRKVAQSLQVNIIGTVGVLIIAKKKGIITNIRQAIFKLRNSGFRLSDDLVNKILEKFGRE